MSPDPLAPRFALRSADSVVHADYARRHRALQVVLAAHLLVLGSYAVVAAPRHTVLELLPVAALLLLSARLPSARLRATCVSLGLYGCSAVLVHLSGGVTEAHFHFFVVLAMISLYRDALPYLVGIGFVLVEHLVVGTIAPSAVFDHPGAALGWALLHAGAIAAASLAQLASWQSAEREHQDERHLLHAELAQLAAVVDDAGIAIISEDLDGTIRSWNPAATALFGYAADDAIGRPKRMLLPPGREEEVEENLAVVRAGRSRSYETQRVDAQGRVLDVALVVSPVRNSAGEVLGASVLARDVSARKATERELVARQAELAQRTQELSQLAYRDPLTGLANRALFLEDLRRLHGTGETGLSVLMIDLDGFKLVNDTAGHAAGDQLLIEAAGRLLRCVRPSDTVSRLGGDEFAVLLPRSTDAALASQRILALLSQPYEIDGRILTVSASVGTAASNPSSTPESLLRDADVALYAAKSSGKNRAMGYDEQMYATMVRRTRLDAGLRVALAEDALTLLYQPVVALRTGEVTGFEALLRWQHPEEGSISPVEFIPLAEQTGQIVPIGTWVLDEALRQAARFSRRAGRPVGMAINVSTRQLEQPDFAALVRDTLARAGLPPSSLIIEVTESALVNSPAALVACLHELRALGVAVAIDDFGTGYSSLDRLRTLPVDQLKVDRAFVSEIDGCGDGQSPVLAAIYAMATALGLDTVAEGVETETQYAALQAMGCDHAQGFLMSRPLPASEAVELLSFAQPFARLGVADGLVNDDVAEVMRLVRSAAAAGEGDDHSMDDLLRAVCAVTGFEAAFISTVDPTVGMQELVFAHNTGQELVRPGERAPWSTSLCRAAAEAGRWVSADVHADFPDVVGPVRSYAGVPLLASDGSVRATLCAVDRIGRPLEAKARETLAFLSRLIADEILLGAGLRRSVVIVDDSPVSRRLLEATLLSLGPYDVVGEAGSVAEAVELCRSLRPDVVLLDVELPDSGGRAAVARIAASCPGMQIVVVSGSAAHASSALAEGATAFLTKEQVVSQLGVVLAPRTWAVPSPVPETAG